MLGSCVSVVIIVDITYDKKIFTYNKVVGYRNIVI